MTRARCRTLPSDWWDTGDDGNRLALLLCRSCPVLERCGQSRGEAGVIRAGVAYADSGFPLPLCGCGYPVVDYRGGTVGLCRWCTGVKRSTPRPQVRGLVDDEVVDRLMRGVPLRAGRFERREAARRLFDSGVPAREIADRLRIRKQSVYALLQRDRKRRAA